MPKTRRASEKLQSFWRMGWQLRIAIFAASVVLVSVCWLGWRSGAVDETNLWQELARVNQRLENGNPASAKEILDELTKTPQQNQEALFRCAQLYFDIGEPSLASGVLNRLKPKGLLAAKSDFLHGIIALHANRAVAAEHRWREAVRIAPKFVPAWERLSQLYLTQMRGLDLRWSLDGLRHCRELTIDELVVYATAFEPYYSAEERLATVGKYVAADPQDENSLAAVVRYRLMDDQVDEALSVLQNCTLQNPSPSVASSWIEVSLRRGELSAAVAVIAPWEQDVSVPLPIVRCRGLIAFSAGDWAVAAWNLRAAVTAQPDDSSGLYKLGQAFERLEQKEAAEAALRIVDRHERLGNLVYRIRKTTHLPRSRLAPLICDVAELLGELARVEEARVWLRLIEDHAMNDRRWREVNAKIADFPLLRPASPASEWSAIKAAKPVGPVVLQGGTARSLNPPLQFGSSEVRLTDCHQQAGLDFQYFSGSVGQKWLLETLGGGVVVLDFDGDGWPDLYFSQGASISPEMPSAVQRSAGRQDRLFRNLGDGRFADVTSSAGLGDGNYSQGGTAGDFDNDGDADLVVANFGRNVFYCNNGDGTFTDMTTAVGLAGERWHTSLAFADLDLDGNLDLYITTYVGEAFKVCRKPSGASSTCSPANYPAEHDVLLLNLGDGTFEDVSESAGIRAPDGKGLGLVIADLNNDGRPDIYVTNDGTPNFLFQNDGIGDSGRLHFSELGMRAGCAVSGEGRAQAGMGIACEDFDGNGYLDLYTTNFFKECSALYLNRGESLFEDSTATAGLLELTRHSLGFGVQGIDFDLSTRKCVLVANGHIDDFGDRNEPWKMRPQLFASDGVGHFGDLSNAGGEFFRQETLGRVVARLDFNRDLKPDAVVTHLDRTAALLRNDTQHVGHAISLDFVGTQSNRDARGCRVFVEAGGCTRLYELSSGDGFMACNERRMTIGLGSAEDATLRVVWPGGRSTTTAHVPSDSAWVLIEGKDPIPQVR